MLLLAKLRVLFALAVARVIRISIWKILELNKTLDDARSTRPRSLRGSRRTLDEKGLAFRADSSTLPTSTSSIDAVTYYEGVPGVSDVTYFVRTRPGVKSCGRC